MKDIIVKNDPKSPISESYRSIRTNLRFANVDNKVKTVMVTSSIPEEGKTTTLSNLAFSMVDLNKKVLVIDCDLRKPRIHKMFNLINSNGVTDILLEGESYMRYVQKVDNGKIDVITAGRVPKNPSELLESDAMKRFIADVRAEYDYVMIDTPPVVPVTDAAIMATYIDGVVFVCASGQVDVNAAKKAGESLRKVDANVLGVVLSKAPVRKGNYKDYYYYSNEGK